MSDKQNVPVYYFMGLLESGKTSVIIDFLQNNQFGKAECNLIILGEEGEEEIDEELLEQSHAKIVTLVLPLSSKRSEERRVGKECLS